MGMTINNDLRNFMKFANAADADACAEMRKNGSVAAAARPSPPTSTPWRRR